MYVSHTMRPTTGQVQEVVTILWEVGMFLYLALGLRGRALSVFTILSLIACKITIRVLLTKFTEIHVQGNAAKSFVRRAVLEVGDDKLFRVCKSEQLSAMSSCD